MAEYGHCPRTTPGMGMGWGRHCCVLLLFFSEILSSWRQQEPPGSQRKLHLQWNCGILEAPPLASRTRTISSSRVLMPKNLSFQCFMCLFLKRQPIGVNDSSERFLVLLDGGMNG